MVETAGSGAAPGVVAAVLGGEACSGGSGVSNAASLGVGSLLADGPGGVTSDAHCALDHCTACSIAGEAASVTTDHHLGPADGSP